MIRDQHGSHAPTPVRLAFSAAHADNTRTMNDPAPQLEPDTNLFSLREVGVAALLMLGMNLIGSGILTFWNGSDDLRGLAGNLLVQFGLFLGVTAVLIRRRLSWKEAFGMKASLFPRSLVIGLLGCVALVPVTFLLHALSQYAITRLGLPASDQLAIQWLEENQSFFFRLCLFVQAVIIAPVCEELFFRGLLLQSLRRYYSAPLAIGLSSLLFAAFHFNLPALLPLFAIASGFAVAYLYSRSLAAAMILHAAYNFINFAWVLWRPTA